ncbi:MAG: DUF559 domain-containing protein [Rickettsiales bacterium]|nr:DUF559 domain-containing protein [Rickettsiales bacterium]
MGVKLNQSNKISLAKKLRLYSSPVEVKFWHAINRNQIGAKFRRQHPIGKYFVDFVCLERNLIIELDGDAHAETIEYDNERTDFLEQAGYKVIRIPNNYIVSELDGVILHLKEILEGKVAVHDYFKSRYEV